MMKIRVNDFLSVILFTIMMTMTLMMPMMMTTTMMVMTLMKMTFGWCRPQSFPSPSPATSSWCLKPLQWSAKHKGLTITLFFLIFWYLLNNHADPTGLDLSDHDVVWPNTSTTARISARTSLQRYDESTLLAPTGPSPSETIWILLHLDSGVLTSAATDGNT